MFLTRLRLLGFLGLVVGSFPDTASCLQAVDHENPFAGGQLVIEEAVVIRGAPTSGVELTNPRAVVADSNSIFILDRAVFGIHRFDGRGVWLGTIGGEGDGPGEFRRPTEMGWLSDTLWVSDTALRRVSFIDRQAGVITRSTRVWISAGSIIAPRGMLGSSILGVPQLSAAEAVDVDSIPMMLLQEDGTIRDTIAWRAVGQSSVSVPIPEARGYAGSGGGPALTIGHPFDRRSLSTTDSKGRWLFVGTWRTGADGSDYFELAQISGAGDTTSVVQLPFDRVSVNQEVVRSHVERVYEGLPEVVRSRVSTKDLTVAVVRQIERPTLATIDAMVAGDDATVWFREGNARRRGEARRWIAYRQGSGFVGFVVLPRAVRLMSASGGLLWTISRDELELPTVTGWSIAWPGGAGSEEGGGRHDG